MTRDIIENSELGSVLSSRDIDQIVNAVNRGESQLSVKHLIISLSGDYGEYNDYLCGNLARKLCSSSSLSEAKSQMHYYNDVTPTRSRSNNEPSYPENLKPDDLSLAKRNNKNKLLTSNDKNKIVLNTKDEIKQYFSKNNYENLIALVKEKAIEIAEFIKKDVEEGIKKRPFFWNKRKNIYQHDIEYVLKREPIRPQNLGVYLPNLLVNPDCLEDKLWFVLRYHPDIKIKDLGLEFLTGLRDVNLWFLPFDQRIFYFKRRNKYNRKRTSFSLLLYDYVLEYLKDTNIEINFQFYKNKQREACILITVKAPLPDECL